MVILRVSHYHSPFMFETFRERSLELEDLDKGDYTAEEYEGCIVELQRVNRWLGDAQALKDSLLEEIERVNLRSFQRLRVTEPAIDSLQFDYAALVFLGGD